MIQIYNILNLVLKHKYIALVCVVLVALWGSYNVGKSSVTYLEMCADTILAAEEVKQSHNQCLERAARLESAAAGREVLVCSDNCDLRIARALEEVKEWACGD